jgi:hypothetical protein
MSRVRRIRPLAWVLVAAGVGLLALSFILDPTPTTYIVVEQQRVPVNDDNAVDYVIGASRVLGIALLIAGGYLGFRDLRPDAIVVDDGMPPSTFDRYSGTGLPEHGDPSSRGGIG